VQKHALAAKATVSIQRHPTSSPADEAPEDDPDVEAESGEHAVSVTAGGRETDPTPAVVEEESDGSGTDDE